MSASVELCCVPPDRVPTLWPLVAHLIRRAMARGRMGRFGEVEADVLAANAWLWLAVESGSVLAAAVTKVTQEDGARLCTIVACAGRDWAKFGRLVAGLEDYARAENCAAMEICGRPGWMRRLPDYRVTKIVMRKRL